MVEIILHHNIVLKKIIILASCLKKCNYNWIFWLCLKHNRNQEIIQVNF